MLRKPTDFTHLLHRLLPLDRLPAAERLHVQRVLAAGDAWQIEQVAVSVLERLAADGTLRRLALPGDENGFVRRYQLPGELAIVTLEMPRPVVRDGILAWPRVSLPVSAQADIGNVRRLVRLDDPAFLDDLRSRDTRLAQLDQLDAVGRELLRAASVRFVPAADSAEAAPADPPLDATLVADAIAHPGLVYHCPAIANSTRLAKLAALRAFHSLAVCAVPSSEGAVLGAIEVCASEHGSWTLDDLARVTLLADAFGAVLDRSSRVEKLVFVDGATGSFNRPYFEVEARNEMARAQRDGASLALAIADVDDFKSFNTVFGYEAGNRVLEHVAHALRRGVRPFDTVARWGGEEFAVLLTAPVQADDVHAICERLRQAVQRVPVEIEGLDGRRHGASVTVSIGVARYPDHGDTVLDLWRAANQALLEAKRSGKNRVVAYGA